MNLKEIAAIAMDEADALAEETLSELVPTEDRKKNFYKATVKQGVKGASVAPASASVPKPKDPATTGPKEPQVDKAAKHAQQYPGSFGNLECFSKSKDGCPKHKTGIYADAGSKFAKLDASGKQVMATEEQRKNAKADDEPDNIGEAQKPAEGAQNPADATVSPEVQKNVAALAKEATEGKDPAAVEQKATAAAEEAAKSLSAPEAKNVGTLNALAQTGYGDKVIDAMVNVVNNEKATEADKVAAAATAVSAIAALQKDAAEGKVSQEQLSAAYEKLEKVTSAAAQKAEEKQTEAEAPKTSENKTLRTAPSKEEQAKMAAAIKNSYGGLYNDFMKDVAAVPDGQCFAAGDDPSEDHYFVKKDGKIYRADANDQPVGDALTADEVMCAMIGEGHLWSDGKRTAGAVPETGEAPAEQPANPAEPAKAPEAEAPQPEKPAEQPAPASEQPKEETAKPETAEQPAATEQPSQMGEAGGTETAAAQPAETAETTATETATSETTETAEGASETTETETTEITQADIDAAKQDDELFEDSVAHLNEVREGAPITMKDDEGNPDSGANKMVKASDGKFYRVDEDGKPTGQGYTAEQAYLEMKNNLDPVKKGESIEDHIRTCKANPKSRCPFLRQHKAEMSPEMQHQVFGGEAPQSDGKPVTAPALKSLVDAGALEEGVARAIETGLTAQNTGLQDEDLDALRESAAKALAGSGEESIRRSLADLANRASAKRINVADPADRDRAVEASVRHAFAETTEESNRRADTLIEQYKKAGLDLSPEMQERIRRNAAIEVYNEAQRQGVDALTEAGVNTGSSMDELVAGLVSDLEQSDMNDADRAEMQELARGYASAKTPTSRINFKKKIESLHDKNVLKLGDDTDPAHVKGMPSSVSDYAGEEVVDWKPEVKGFGDSETKAANSNTIPTIEAAKKSLDVAKIPGKLDKMSVTQNQNTTTIKIPLEQYVKDKKTGEDKAIPESRIKNLVKDMQKGGDGKTVSYDPSVGDGGAIVISIPNTTKGSMGFGKLMNTQEWKDAVAKGDGAFCVGTNAEDGTPIISSLEEMVHMFIGGDTGQGKSSRIGNIVGSLAVAMSPDDIEFIGIDPKKNGLVWMSDFPQTTDRITDMDKAVDKLKWLTNEMESRAKLMERFGAKNIQAYNQLGKEGKLPKDVPQKLKYIVPVIDEFADLIETHGTEVTHILKRIGNMARSSGIHLVAATQKPSADQIPKTLMTPFVSRMGLAANEAPATKMIMGTNETMLNSPEMKHKGRIITRIGDRKAVMGDGSYVDESKMSEIGKKQKAEWEQFKKDHPSEGAKRRRRDKATSRFSIEETTEENAQS